MSNGGGKFGELTGRGAYGAPGRDDRLKDRIADLERRVAAAEERVGTEGRAETAYAFACVGGGALHNLLARDHITLAMGAQGYRDEDVPAVLRRRADADAMRFLTEMTDRVRDALRTGRPARREPDVRGAARGGVREDAMIDKAASGRGTQGAAASAARAAAGRAASTGTGGMVEVVTWVDGVERRFSRPEPEILGPLAAADAAWSALDLLKAIGAAEAAVGDAMRCDRWEYMHPASTCRAIARVFGAAKGAVSLLYDSVVALRGAMTDEIRDEVERRRKITDGANAELDRLRRSADEIAARIEGMRAVAELIDLVKAKRAAEEAKERGAPLRRARRAAGARAGRWRDPAVEADA